MYITKDKYEFLKNALSDASSKDLLKEENINSIMSDYQIKKALDYNFIIILFSVILIGLGIILALASNYTYITYNIKQVFVLILMFGSYYLFYKLRLSNRYLSFSFLLLFYFLYGTSIFLISQRFNFFNDNTFLFLLWAIPILIGGILLKEKSLNVFFIILFSIYLMFEDIGLLYFFSTFLLVLSYYFNHLLYKSKFILFFNNLNFIIIITKTLDYYDVDSFFINLIVFIIGILMYYKEHSYNRDIFKIQGNIFFGISGLIFTYKETYDIFENILNPNYISIIFSILFISFLIFLITKQNITSIVFLAILIFRYYFDDYYDFIPKSLFFVIGGALLLSIIEYIRRKKGEFYEE
ncbi:MAG: DUF2157 domain-containing protein [Peptostreptococcaceae bacterium]|jgi:uncharacterized membrane protein|nr:DUF2157 domain-containing protein [Peptostreptococcaceae bacterium]